MADQKLYEELENHIKEILSADLFGVADLRPVSDYVRKQGGEFLASFPYGISIGIHLSDGIVDQLIHYSNLEVQFAFTFHVYNVVNPRLDEIALLVTQKLQGKGYRAFPVATRNNPYLIMSSDAIFSESDKLRSAFSHKLTAHMAGSGWVGKNCLLVTPEFGPRVWLTSVLTDAPLPTGEMMEDRCRGCTLCVQTCPAGAIKGRIFNPEEDLDERFDAIKCHHYRRGVLKKKFGFDGCGLCVAVCPYGKPKHLKIQ